MIDFIKKTYIKYEEIVNYLIIGVMTTVISLITKYALLFTVLDAKNPLQLQISIIVSWIIAVIFAYVTNRKFVFKSKSEKILKEFSLFISSRIVTLVMESVILWFFITYLHLDSNMYVIIWTILTQFIVIVGNYILSKFFVFSKTDSKKENKSINREIYFYIVFFLLVLILCYLFPYTHDDWDWGSVTGLERLKNSFDNFNGRWLGNSLGMLLTRVRILKSITIASTLLAIIILIKKLINSDKKYIPYFVIISFLLMPVRMFAQSFAWTVSFANYVPPVLIALFIIYKNKSVFQEKKEEISNKWILPFLLLGFMGTLFMEHLTIYLVVLGIFLLVVDFVKNKKIMLANIFYLIGSIAGSILMFSNTGYRTLFGEGDGYRSIEDGNIFIRSITTYFGEFKNLLVNNNFALNTILSILALILIYQFLKKNKKTVSPFKKITLKVSSSILMFFLSYQFFLKMVANSNAFIRDDFRRLIEGILILGYALAIIATVLIAVLDKERRKRMLFEIGSIVMISAPLLIVKPIGPRCFFATYLFFTILAAEFLDLVLKNEKFDFTWMLRTGSYTLISLFLIIYGYCFMIEQKRVNYMNEHKNEEKLVLPKIPYNSFMQVPNPGNDWFRTQYRQYYDLNENVELEFIDYKEWKKRYQ